MSLDLSFKMQRACVPVGWSDEDCHHPNKFEVNKHYAFDEKTPVATVRSSIQGNPGSIDYAKNCRAGAKAFQYMFERLGGSIPWVYFED